MENTWTLNSIFPLGLSQTFTTTTLDTYPFIFDGVSKTILLESGTIQISIRDLWSRWVDWSLTSDNSKYLPAMSQVGGNNIDVSAGTYIPIYIFLLNGWKIKPQEANHTLNVNDGILVVDGGGDPFINTIGAFTVRINYSQPVQAITVATGGGGGATASDIWNYSSRTLTESAGLSTEEHNRLFELPTSSGGGFSSQSIQTSLQNVKKEIIGKIDEIQPTDVSSIEKKLDEIDSHNSLAKDEIITRIEEVETEVCSDIIRKNKEIKDDNIKTRNLVRQKTKKLDENTQKLADRMDLTDKMIEDEADDLEEQLEAIFESEAEMIEKEIEDQIEKEIQDIESELNSNPTNNGND